MSQTENPLNKNALSNAFLTPNFFKRVVTALLLGGLTLWMLITESPFIGYYGCSLRHCFDRMDAFGISL